MIRRPPRSTLFPYRRSSDLLEKTLIHPRSLRETSDRFLPLASLPRGLAQHELGGGVLRIDLQLFLELLGDRKSTRLNSSHLGISYAVFCLKKKKKTNTRV